MNSEEHMVNLFGRSDPGLLVIVTKSVTADSRPTRMLELGLKLEKYFKSLAKIRLKTHNAPIKHIPSMIFIW